MPLPRRAEIFLLLTVVIWGLNFPIIKIALGPMPPFVVNALRFALSVVVLGAMHAASTKDFWRPLREHPVRIALLACLGFAGYQLFFILGVDRTTAGNAALIVSSVPVWIALGARVFGLERLPRRAMAGLALGFAGTAGVVAGGTGALTLAADAFVGNLLMLGGTFMWAAYTLLSRPLLDRGISGSGLAFFGLMLSLPVLWGLGAWEWHLVDWAGVDWRHWVALLFSGVLSTGAAYAWWNTAVRTLGPSQTAVWNYLTPVVALVTGVILLGEPVSLAQILGGACILVGVLLMRSARKSPPPPPPLDADPPATHPPADMDLEPVAAPPPLSRR
jgi:drug/metabolite transporter (DMT)-like permease